MVTFPTASEVLAIVLYLLGVAFNTMVFVHHRHVEDGPHRVQFIVELVLYAALVVLVHVGVGLYAFTQLFD